VLCGRNVICVNWECENDRWANARNDRWANWECENEREILKNRLDTCRSSLCSSEFILRVAVLCGRSVICVN